MAILNLLFGVFCCSLAVLFIKGSETDPTLLSGYRLLVGGGLLIPLWWRARKAHPDFSYRGRRREILLSSIFLAVHFVTWIAGARLTPGANASLLVNMTPVVMPFILYAFVREVLTATEWRGTALAMVGVCILGVGDFNFSQVYALGDAICFGSMLLYAAYLGFGRRHSDIPSIHLYVVPVYLLAGLMALAFGTVLVALGHIPAWIGPRVGHELLMILGLGILPTILGHSIINWAFKHLRGQVVALLNLGQFVFAGLTTYLFLREVPTPAFYGAVFFVIAGAVLVLRKGKGATVVRRSTTGET